MICLNEEIAVCWNPANKKHYEDKGYVFTKNGDEFFVKIYDLPTYSDKKIPVVCDFCNEIYYPSYKNYNKCHEDGKLDCCKKCSSKKAKNTMLLRYGVSHYQQTEECKSRKRNVCLSRYGVDNPSKVKEIQDKKVATNIKKFSADWYVASDKFKEYCIERYNVDNPMKCKEIKDKSVESLFKNGNIPISSEEIKFGDILKKKYGDKNCISCYRDGRFIFDFLLLVDNMKIDVEYDGAYWHSFRKEYDRKRDEVIKSHGYKIFRVVSNGEMPSCSAIEEAIEFLSIDGNDFTRIKV